jgi:hypothetical protein
MGCVTHQVGRLAEDSRECLEDVHYRSEAVDQALIAIAIFFKGLLPFLK